jgi:hypothetical protein
MPRIPRFRFERYSGERANLRTGMSERFLAVVADFHNVINLYRVHREKPPPLLSANRLSAAPARRAGGRSCSAPSTTAPSWPSGWAIPIPLTMTFRFEERP